LKFTPEGGRVSIRAEQAGEDSVCFSIVDTGTGIPPESLPHLFEPFWQARDRATLGTGLGLSIARGIIEAHRGQISVQSTPGEGTTFRFSVPVA
jgi:signal transduction histidine kinase